MSHVILNPESLRFSKKCFLGKQALDRELPLASSTATLERFFTLQ